MSVKQRADYTFKYNQKFGRHAWLRLTPAYSVKLVKEIMAHTPVEASILDPFSGTATTGLVAAEQNRLAECWDINPFLIWLGRAKCRSYTTAVLDRLRQDVHQAVSAGAAKNSSGVEHWLPSIHNITRWWDEQTLSGLASLRQALVEQFGEPQTSQNEASTLAWIAFCRLIIETSSAAFNHVSVSFQDDVAMFHWSQLCTLYLDIFEKILASAPHPLPGRATIYLQDARQPRLSQERGYTHVITSPPYPNRLSYIRELRPYMYWTKFLTTAPEAGELDWQAIGGTWGIATSRLKSWEPNGVVLPNALDAVVAQILDSEEKNALLMGNYVWKYFYDMYLHLQNLRQALQPGAILTYIVGNSSFYGVQVPTEKLLELFLSDLGFSNVGSRIVRKRNSKKELFEFCVYATWQERALYEPTFFTAARPTGKQLTLF